MILSLFANNLNKITNKQHFNVFNAGHYFTLFWYDWWKNYRYSRYKDEWAEGWKSVFQNNVWLFIFSWKRFEPFKRASTEWLCSFFHVKMIAKLMASRASVCTSKRRLRVCTSWFMCMDHIKRYHEHNHIKIFVRTAKFYRWWDSLNM